MEVMIEKIAEIFEVTIKEATRLYPILRTQVLWYEFLGVIKTIVGVTVLLSVFSISGMGTLFLLSAGGTMEFEKRWYKFTKVYIPKAIKVLLISTAIYLGVYALTLVLAPDLVLLQKFIIK